MEGKTEDHWSVRTHRAWTATLCWPERGPRPQVQRGFSSHSGASNTPRAEGASGSLVSPRSDIQTKVFRDSGERGSSGRAFSPTPATAPAARQPIPTAPAEEPRAAECGLRTRQARGLARRAAPGAAPGSARPPRPQRPRQRGERSSPCHFAPVGGNLRSVTPILRRATCSARLAALGGAAGLGRRGAGTLGSGGHAGVGAPRRPAAAAR